MEKENSFFESLKKGDEVCFMNDRIQIETDEVLQVFYSSPPTHEKFVALKYSHTVIQQSDSARLFPKEKKQRLFTVIQALLMDTETDLEKLQVKMVTLMSDVENTPLYLPAPAKANT